MKFLQAYAADGVPVQAVTVQNEVDTDQDGRMPACAWPQEYEMGFVKNHLGPALQKNGLATKIWILDHNYNLWGRAVAEFDDPDVHKYCNAAAFHGYVGTPDQMTKFHEALSRTHRSIGRKGGRTTRRQITRLTGRSGGKRSRRRSAKLGQSITGWNLALDEKGRPNIGPFPCGGMVTIHSQSRKTSLRAGSIGRLHTSRDTIRRGAKRFETSGNADAGVDHVAFENPDGQKVLVLSELGARLRRLHYQ